MVIKVKRQVVPPPDQIPVHLQKYIVEQNYEKYTPRDHAVWRYVLRQLKSFLKKNAHECYLEGLDRTGIDVEAIPKISAVSEKLKEFGWRALPVSGFIPPAAFMELQSLGVLPIASDMRSLEHLLYTPAPDIVHEAAGHAPILIQPEYADYLRQYAQIAKKAILSRQDLEQYEAIRLLSDLKENQNSTESEIKNAESKLASVTNNTTFISEAAELSRMNWWTAEYGLIGPLENPKIFGAGLLSSVGEAKWCLSEKVKRIPLTLDCIQQSYDITEPQPQLFVAKDFKNLVEVLHQMAATMAFNVGGIVGLDKAIQAASVNTTQLDSGLQISGVHLKYILDDHGQIAYLQYSGPTQISYGDKQLKGHEKTYHQHGFGTPVGELTSMSFQDLKIGQPYSLKYNSGLELNGKLEKILTISTTAQILTFSNATAKFKNQILFQPDWGLYDIVTGQNVASVFGGPADRISYGDTDDFVASQIMPPTYTEKQKILFNLYQMVRELRTQGIQGTQKTIHVVLESIKKDAPSEWLLFVELLEISETHHFDSGIKTELKNILETLKLIDQKTASLIADGVSLIHATI